MKTINDIVLLGDKRLYEVCQPVKKSEIHFVKDWVADLDNVMKEIRAKYKFGRAIAAPQLGIMKRLIYMNIDKPVVFINPEFSYRSDEKFELWDDCMSFDDKQCFRKKDIPLCFLYHCAGACINSRHFL